MKAAEMFAGVEHPGSRTQRAQDWCRRRSHHGEISCRFDDLKQH